MNAASLPVNCSAVLDAESPAGHCMEAPADLARFAFQSLETHPDFRWRLAGWGIQIESNGDKVILNGRVPSWYLKQLLQETLRRVDGVGSVENRVVVVHPDGQLSVSQT
jgi:hypothetical protein